MFDNISSLKSKTILFAEDDNIIKSEITEVLEMIFKKVYSVEDGMEAFEVYEEKSPDIIISDINMPYMDGITLIDKIRKIDYSIPIVLVTSFSEKKMLMDAVNLSVDGYIIKPIELKILINTINKAMKRVKKEFALMKLGANIFFNSNTQELYEHGKLVSLGVKELELLKLLIQKSSKTVTKEEISKVLWPLDSICESAIKNLVLRMRKKIGTDIIRSVRGIGYRLDINPKSE